MDVNNDILNKRVLPNDDLVSWKVIDQEVIFLHKKERSFYELNKTASFIWNKAVDRLPVGKIIDSFVGNYDIDRNTAESDILECVKDLLNREILIIQ